MRTRNDSNLRRKRLLDPNRGCICLYAAVCLNASVLLTSFNSRKEAYRIRLSVKDYSHDDCSKLLNAWDNVNVVQTWLSDLNAFAVSNVEFHVLCMTLKRTSAFCSTFIYRLRYTRKFTSKFQESNTYYIPTKIDDTTIRCESNCIPLLISNLRWFKLVILFILTKT